MEGVNVFIRGGHKRRLILLAVLARESALEEAKRLKDVEIITRPEKSRR